MANTLAIINGTERTSATVSVDVVRREVLVTNSAYESGASTILRMKCSGAKTLIAVLQTAIDELNQ